MADEARAMLDALMGADRNASQQQQPSEHERGGGPKRKRSCYDPAVCPLYCAWGGTDLHELFRNTKSDLGPNPRVCDDDALEEYASLPDHERDRLARGSGPAWIVAGGGRPSPLYPVWCLSESSCREARAPMGTS